MNRSNKQSSTKKRRLADFNELTRAIDESFFKALRRPPLQHDRIFYWSYCYSDSEFKRMMIRSFLEAEMPQHLIFIYDKTGFILDEISFQQLSKKEKAEVRSAGREYLKIEKKSEGPIYKHSDYNDDFSIETSPLVNALYIFGNFIDRNINSTDSQIGVRRFVSGYLMLRAFRTARMIFRSERFETAEETLMLVRSLYEIYCKICYAVESDDNAEYLINSDLGLATGHYETLRKDGKLKRNILVNKETGSTLPRYKSFYEYVSSSPIPADRDIFELLYEYLSSFVHSGLRHMPRAFNRKKGFTLFDDNEDLKALSLMLACFVCALIMQASLSLPNISDVSKWDICLFCVATKKTIEGIETPIDSPIADLLKKVKERAALFPAEMPDLKFD